MSNVTDSPHDIDLIFILFIFVIVAFLYMFDGIATIPWAIFHYAESYIWVHVLFFMPDYFVEPHRELLGIFNSISWTDDIDWPFCWEVERVLSYKTTWLYALPLLKHYYTISKKNRTYDHLRKTLNFDQLLAYQSNMWRYTRYLLKNNPLKITKNANESVYAIRASVLHGLKRTKILFADRNKNEVIFDKDRALEVFSGQLKHLINVNKLNELDNIHKFLICVFSLRLLGDEKPVYTDKELKKAKKKLKNRKRLLKIMEIFKFNKLPFFKSKYKQIQQSYMHYCYADMKTERLLFDKSVGLNENLRLNLLGDISFHFNDELDFKYIQRHIDHIFPQVINSKVFNELLGQHAYLETLLRRLIRESRVYGKMPPNHFSWLKKIDRELWYAISDEGLPGASFESCGVHSHYELEYKCKNRFYFPCVDQAIVSLSYPKTVLEFDAIKTPQKHPLAKLYPYNPAEEKQEHLEKLKTDPDYRLQQLKLNEMVK